MSSSPFDTPEFLKLQAEYYKKLEDSGFKDIEDKKGRLINPDRRTIAFENRDRTRDFFLALDEYLNTTKDKIPPKYRQVLELYSQGVRVMGPNGISATVGLSDRHIRWVIRKYKDLVISGFPHL